MKKLLLCVVTFTSLVVLYAGDIRTVPMDMYLMIDGSTAIHDTKDEIIDWLSTKIIDSIVQEGDTVTICLVQKLVPVIFSDTINKSGKDTAKKAIKAIVPAGTDVDFDQALAGAANRSTSQDHIQYTLLVSGSVTGLSAAMSGKSASLLRFSKVEDHHGWQTVVLAPGIAGRVQRAATDFLSGR
jgi:hypothetical protein